jgi:outer membrane lipopolysaccharide assembly protein LptE/RlpB
MAARKIQGGVILLLLLVTSSGCGYRLAGGAIEAGQGETLAVPIFDNLTTDFRVEQRLTAAVRRELVQRTQYRVVPGASGDVVLDGQVLSITSIPIILTDRGRGTAYTVAVNISVRMTDTSDGSVVFENPFWTFREVFEVSNSSEAFVPEDTAAMDRLARRFAESLVAALFNAKS